MMLASLYLTFFSVLLSFPFAKSTDDISHLSIYTDEVNVYTGLFHNFILQKPMTPTMLEIGKPIKLDIKQTLCSGPNAYSDVYFKPNQFHFKPLQLENNLVVSFEPQVKEHELKFMFSVGKWKSSCRL